jgi:hypothetical protein
LCEAPWSLRDHTRHVHVLGDSASTPVNEDFLFELCDPLVAARCTGRQGHRRAQRWHKEERTEATYGILIAILDMVGVRVRGIGAGVGSLPKPSPRRPVRNPETSEVDEYLLLTQG